MKFFAAPIIALFTTPIRLIQSLWDSRELLNGKGLDRYPNFQVARGVNYCWYWNRARELHRYGRRGVSPILGMNGTKLSRLFHFSIPSLYLFWRMGAALLIIGMFSWLLIHMIWMSYSGIGWTLGIMSLALISNYFYPNLFGHQNYHVVGWAFFPLVLFGLITQNWPMLALGALFSSFGGFTFPFMIGLLCILLIPLGHILPMIIALVPMALKVLIQILPHLSDNEFKRELMITAKSMGLSPKGVKYKRTTRGRFYPHTAYILSLCSLFLIVHWILTASVSWYFLAVMIIVLLNFSVLRFADDQSMQMLILSSTTAVTIHAGEPWLLVAYWIAISPAPFKTNYPGMPDLGLVVPRLEPFDISPVFAKLRTFFSSIPDKDKVYMAFSDPQDDYHKLFDGYTFILETAHYVAGERYINLIPDLWGVFELNYPEAPNIWGRDPEKVLKNAQTYGANYLMIYTQSGQVPGLEWEQAGWKVISEMHWEELYEIFRKTKPYYGPTPSWWLLESIGN